MIRELEGRREEGGNVMATLYFVISSLNGIESSYGY